MWFRCASHLLWLYDIAYIRATASLPRRSFASLGLCDETLLEAICTEVIARITSTPAAAHTPRMWRSQRAVTARGPTTAADIVSLDASPAPEGGERSAVNGAAGSGGQGGRVVEQQQQQQYVTGRTAGMGVGEGSPWNSSFPDQAVANVAW